MSKVTELAKLWPHDDIFWGVLIVAYCTFAYYTARALPGFIALRKGQNVEAEARVCASMSRCQRMLCYLSGPIMALNFIGLLAMTFKLPETAAEKSGGGASSSPVGNHRSPYSWAIIFCGGLLGLLPSQCTRVVKNRLTKAKAEGKTNKIAAYQSTTLVMTSISSIFSSLLVHLQNKGVTKIANGFKPDFVWVLSLVAITVGVAIVNLVYMCSMDVATALFLNIRRNKAPYAIDEWCDESFILEMYAAKRSVGDEKVPILVEYHDEKEAILESMV